MNTAMQKLGEKIVKLRLSKNISLEELAQKCNLSTTQLSIIENGDITPSLYVIIKISHALDISVGTLLDGIEDQGVEITRKDERPECVSFSNGTADIEKVSTMEFFSMAPAKKNRNMEPFFICINSDNNNIQELSSHEGEEFVFVVSGTIELTHGENISIIKEGDSVYYDSIVPHKIRSVSETAKMIAVIYAPV